MSVPHLVLEIARVAATIAVVLLPPAFLAGAFLVVRRVWGRSFWLGIATGATWVVFLFGMLMAVVDISTALLLVAALGSLMLVALATRWAFDDWFRYRPDPGKPLAWPGFAVAAAGKLRGVFSNDVVSASDDQ